MDEYSVRKSIEKGHLRHNAELRGKITQFALKGQDADKGRPDEEIQELYHRIVARNFQNDTQPEE